MSNEERTILDQLEDALLKIGPAGGGVVGGLVGAGLLKDYAPPIIGFIAGGALGGVVVYAILYGLFLVVNPNRDR